MIPLPQFKQIIEKLQVSESGCWTYTGYLNDKGYGQIHNGKKMRVHRLVFEAFKGKIPEGAYILHLCDNPACCNPDHLVAGTAADNMIDMAQKGRSTIGERNPSSKLTFDQVKEIREKYSKPGSSLKKLAKEYNVSFSLISLIVNNKIWRSQ